MVVTVLVCKTLKRYEEKYSFWKCKLTNKPSCNVVAADRVGLRQRLWLGL